MSGQVITSLALLEVEWRRGGGYIQSFVPFVAECLRTAPQGEVSLPDLGGCLVETFGLRIPQGALKTIVKRAVREGYARAEKGIYRRNDDTLRALDFEKRKTGALRQYEALIGKLIDFCEVQHGISWLREEADAVLLDYLKGRLVPLLGLFVEGAPLTKPKQSAKQSEFLVGAFVAHVCRQDPEGFKYLETVVKGSMLANALYFPQLGQASQHFGRVKVFFDTRVLLRALGEAGASLQAPCQESLDLLYGLNAELGCFEQTVEEMRGILEVVANTLRYPTRLRNSYGEVLEYYIRTGLRASDAELANIRLEKSLRRLRVQTESLPPYEEELTIDEDRLGQVLRARIPYGSESAVLHDLKILSAIHRLRRGEFPRRIESSNAIFVTTNANLTRVSRLFFRAQYGREAVVVPYCILDHVLTTLAWLKRPQRAPDLPRKMIVANCFAALDPGEVLWKAFLRAINRQRERGEISEDEFYLLRFSIEARQILMQVTLGDVDAFAEGTAAEVLQRSLKVIRAEDRERIAAESRAREAAERVAASAQTRLEHLQRAQRERIRSIAIWVGHLSKGIVVSLAIVAQLLALYLSFSPGPLSRRIVFVVVTCIVSGFEIVDLTWDKCLIKSGVRSVQSWTSRIVEGVLTRTFVPKESELLGSPESEEM